MRFFGRLGLPLLLLAAGLNGVAVAQQNGFENLIEDTLKRLQGEPAPTEEAQPAPPGAPSDAPQQLVPGGPPPSEPQSAPTETGPHPYTPPTIKEPLPIDEQTPAAPPASPPATTPQTEATGQNAPGTSTETPAATSSQPAATTSAPAAETNAEPQAPAAEGTRESLTPDAVNAAVFPDTPVELKGASPLVLKAQILLDRAGASPGAIDGYAGGNLSRAVAAVEAVLGLPVDGTLDRQVWDAIGGDDASPVLVEYTITLEDLPISLRAGERVRSCGTSDAPDA